MKNDDDSLPNMYSFSTLTLTSTVWERERGVKKKKCFVPIVKMIKKKCVTEVCY